MTALQTRTAARPASTAPAGAGRRARLFGAGTPGRIRALLVTLLLASLAWGGVGAWTVATHSAAAASVAYTDEPLSLHAQRLYQDIANGDLLITTAFLKTSQGELGTQPGTPPPSTLAARRQFDAYLSDAAKQLAVLDATPRPGLAGPAAAIGAGLPAYSRDVSVAATVYAQNVTPAGDSAMEVASEDANQTLLPQAQAIYNLENAAEAASGEQATSLVTVIAAVGLALLAAVALVIGHQWLARRTRRTVNVGLAVTALALVVSGIWLTATFAAARADLDAAIGQGARPAQDVAQASIDVQQLRGDSLVNVINVINSTSDAGSAMAQVSQATTKDLAARLADAAAAGNTAAAGDLAKARTTATSWNRVNAQDYALGEHDQYANEQQAVIGAGGPASAGYAALQDDLVGVNGAGGALAAAQDTFNEQATAAAGAFGGLEAGVIAAAGLMAAGAAWGLDRRLAEYR